MQSNPSSEQRHLLALRPLSQPETLPAQILRPVSNSGCAVQPLSQHNRESRIQLRRLSTLRERFRAAARVRGTGRGSMGRRVPVENR
jgi:hypothetical protein